MEKFRYPDEMRISLRSQMITSGIPETMVDEIVDLAFHASEEAIDTIWRITGQGSNDGICTCAVGPAMSLLAATAGEQLTRIQDYAAKRGMKSATITVSA